MTADNGDRPVFPDPDSRSETWTVRAQPEIYAPPYQPYSWPEQKPSLRSLLVAIGLFILTAFSTLAAGAQFAAAYAVGQPAIVDYTAYFRPFAHTHLFLSGVPFALTLMVILLAHELGHYFACRYYQIHASYPFFIPAPTLIGTFGAFIRIRSPIINRRALFDVALAGPLMGFLVAVPAMSVAIAKSKFMLINENETVMVFGHPLIERILEALLRPGLPHETLLLHPIGRAAWIGIFVTALNLLPAGQLDGGHILYALASERHRRVTLAVAILLVPLAYYWEGWLMWAILLLAIGFRHPPLMDRWEPLDSKRRSLALVALVIFILCFMLTPLAVWH